MSQIRVYLSPQKMDEIKELALQKAEEDFAREAAEDRGRRKAGWTEEEKWTLLWATEYAKKKCGTNKSKEYTKMWRSIMEKYYPDRKNHTNNTTQLANVKKSGAFSDRMTYLREMAEQYIAQQKDPLTEPIKMPDRATNESPALPTLASTGTLEPDQPLPESPDTTAAPEHPAVPDAHLRNFQQASTTPPRGNNISPISTPPSTRSISTQTIIAEPIDAQTPNQETLVQTPALGTPASRPGNQQNLPDLDSNCPITNQLAVNITTVMNKPMEQREPLRRIFQNQKFRQITKTVNDALPNLLNRNAPLTEINQIHYAAALTIQNQILPHKPRSGNNSRARKQTPPWKTKLTGQITTLRAEASRLEAYLRGQSSRGLTRKIQYLKRKYRMSSNEQLSGKLTEIKMLITTKAKIIKNKEEKILSKNQNKEFERDPKKFFQTLNEEKIEVKTPPSEEDVNTFWRGIYEDDRDHNDQANWIQVVEEQLRGRPRMEDQPITDEEFQRKLRTMKNFKSPGPDQLTNFWLKTLPALHPHYLAAFNRILSGEERAPLWLSEGLTRLLPKSAETHRANKYRPICCLPTTYKLLTGIISERLYDHLSKNDLLSEQQKGCIKDCLGTKDQLLLNKAILENCRRRATNLWMAWLDYQKAYDSVPHSWIRKCLHLYGVSRNIEMFIADTMTKWKTRLLLKHEKGEIVLKDVKIKRGIFQGDSLSPLLFCLSIDPLSRMLNSKDNGYNMNARGQEPQKVGHLLYMDDLKLYANSEKVLKDQLNTVREFSADITMKFGLDKCAIVAIEKGKFKKSEGIHLQDLSIKALEEGETYKYLGVEETNKIDHTKMRKLHKEGYVKTLKMILKTKLTTKNKILAINQIAIPKIQYSFGIIDWPQLEINSIDISTRKLLCQYRAFYKDQCHARLYIPRAKGGMGLIEIDATHKATIISLAQYIVSGTGLYAAILRKHYSITSEKSLIKLAEVFLHPQKLDDHQGEPTKKARKTRRQFVQSRQELNMEDWKKNKRAGRFANRMEEQEIDKNKSYEWLKRGVLNFDSERIILAAQDDGLLTNGLKKIFKLTNNDKCRFCQESVETTTHLLSGCPKLLAEGRYTTRHNNVCRVIHWRLCQKYGFEAHDVSWKHKPQPFLENQHAKITYDAPIPAARHITDGAVRPDIVVLDKHTRRGYIIDVCVPNDYGLARQEREKVTKYQDLKNDMKDTYGYEPIDIIPVVIGATGTMKRNLQRYIQLLPCKITSLELQIEVVRETTSMLKRALGCRLAT